MKEIRLLCVLTFFSFFLVNSEVNACTTFCLQDGEQLVFGRNFDFPVGYGHVLINKRNMRKSAMVRPPEKPFEWTSIYGSISFNQNGREFPYGGINERGLVIEQMALNSSVYPEIDDRFGLTELQWIQYQLDNSASVQEVIASRGHLRISPQSVAGLHFLVADRAGNVATIEFIGGEMVVHSGESLPVTALANDTYEDSMGYLENFSGFGGTREIPVSTAPLDRFVNVAASLTEYSGEDPVSYSFDILDRVNQGQETHWSIVYDITNSEIHYRTVQNPEVRKISVSDFNFGCNSPVLYINIDEAPVEGKLRFNPFSPKENEELINKVWSQVEFLAPIPVEVRKYYADYPLSVTCEQKKI
ncbi:linear amide C-N hydrolase [Salinimicrobium xinjiangense]|uniref:linear amide C-N hydrolase n=1 Tax=Salinimicrobium xinjiangense TaxID=438596 RepID=UPI000403E48B|nr:linear amide C-N hydrolase [Salinimicrobium xinjiangense]